MHTTSSRSRPNKLHLSEQMSVDRMTSNNNKTKISHAYDKLILMNDKFNLYVI